MDRRPIVPRRLATPLPATPLLAALVVVSGCGTPAPPAEAPGGQTTAASAGPAATGEPVASSAARSSLAPDAPSTPVPWPGLAISGTSTGDAITGTLLTLDDPVASIRMPADWQAHTTAEVRAYVVSVLDLVPATYRDYYDQFLARIDAGDFRCFISGPSGVDGVTASITVEVGPPHDGQPDAVAEIRAESKELGTARDIAHLDWQTALGDGTLATAILDPPPDIPSVTTRTVLLVVPLADGRMWTLRATGPESSTTFVGMVGTVIRSIARPYFHPSAGPSPAPGATSSPALAGDSSSPSPSTSAGG